MRKKIQDRIDPPPKLKVWDPGPHRSKPHQLTDVKPEDRAKYMQPQDASEQNEKRTAQAKERFQKKIADNMGKAAASRPGFQQDATRTRKR